MNYIKFFKWIFVIIAIAIICYTIFLILATIGIFYVGCNFTSGQVRPLAIPTKLSKEVCVSITDSLIATNWKYNIPAVWKAELLEQGKISSDHKNFEDYYYYFSADSINPEVIYDVRWRVPDIFRLIYKDKTISPNLLPTEQKEEILERFENEILNTIEREAKRQGWADDSLYCTKYEY